MRRVPDLIDVWFDSGAMPFAQWHYPFENRERFTRSFPADFIAEGVDQTRGWFYTLHAIATIVMDDVAYKNVVVGGLVLAEDGEKMSKSKGNAVDPFRVIEEHGADLVRWYMMSNSPPWENIKFSERGIVETLRKFMGTLENVYSFFATYANIDGFDYSSARIPVPQRAELDRWIMSRLNTTVEEVDAAFAAYNPTKAARGVERFVDELSNWYVRRSRRRFWKEADDETDKRAAYQTVYECLLAVSKLMSPISPFFGEWLYQELRAVTGHEPALSVHLAAFPEVEPEAVDRVLEHRMHLARTVSSIVLSLRNKSGINVRQPLPRAMVVTGAGVEQDDVERVREIILDEVNVKDLEYIAGSSGIVRRTARPNFKRLGSRLGKRMKAVAAAVRELTDEEIGRFVREGAMVLRLDGGADSVELSGDDLEVATEGVAGWLVEQEDGVTVALDTTLDEALIGEGLARETINRIQNLRKNADFDVTDRIRVQYRAGDRLAAAIRAHAAWIRNETLALELDEAERPDGEVVEAFEVGDESLTVAARRVERP